MSIRNEMDANHVETIARINHIIVSKNDNHHHYSRFYREMCDSWIITMVMMVKDGIRV